MSATRTEAHTLTTREVMKIFEEAGIPRAQRSIERYCQQGDLDCKPDAIERRQYITRESVDILIGQLKELAARHQTMNPIDDQQMSPTADDDMQRRPATAATSESVKHGTPEKQREKHPTGEYDEQLAKENAEMKARLKELENENFLLKVGKQAAEQVVTKLGDYIKEDRENFTKLILQTNEHVAKYSRRLGQLEIQIKHRQLPAPDSDATADDDDELDDATSIEAEFSETPHAVQHESDNFYPNNATRP
jgi:hypothetical protein